MRFQGRFQEELDALHVGGREFAHLNPKLAKHLLEEGSDPDVGRILEGLAFLTSRVRDKLDADITQLDQSMIQLLWPQFLRPSPPFTLLNLEPHNSLEKKVIPEGTYVLSRPIENVTCKFRTTTDCTVIPLKIVHSDLGSTSDGHRLSVTLQSLSPIAHLELDRLRLWFCGDASSAQMLYLWVCRYLKEVQLTDNSQTVHTIAADQITPGGFEDEEFLLPSISSAFHGYQMLQEYFSFPDKFYCVDIKDKNGFLRQYTGTELTFELHFQRPVPPEIKLRENNIRINCVPAINLFEVDAEPLAIDHKKVSYPVLPQTLRFNHDNEIFSINSVESWYADKDDGSARWRSYPRFESFEHEADFSQNAHQVFYREELKPRTRGEAGFSREVSFVLHGTQPGIPAEETVSIQLSCFNRHLASELSIGDICDFEDDTITDISVQNVTRPTNPVFPPLDGSLDWTLIAHLSLNYVTLLDKRALSAVMSIYDVSPASDLWAGHAARKRTDGMVSLETKPYRQSLRGLPIQGQKTILELQEDCFQTEGDMYLFAGIIAQFYKLYTTTNAFHELEVHGILHGEVYRWPALLKR